MIERWHRGVFLIASRLCQECRRVGGGRGGGVGGETKAWLLPHQAAASLASWELRSREVSMQYSSHVPVPVNLSSLGGRNHCAVSVGYLGVKDAWLLPQLIQVQGAARCIGVKTRAVRQPGSPSLLCMSILHFELCCCLYV